MTLYTGRGDEGKTDLSSQTRVSKTDPRIEASGTVDELNAHIGTLQPTGYEDVDDVLAEVQNQLHILQAEFSNPDPTDADPTVESQHIEHLEETIDAFDGELPTLQTFVLPNGSEVGSHLHLARTVCRRAERRAVALADGAHSIRSEPLTYLNRLSDLLFVLARVANHRAGVGETAPTY